MRPWEAVRMIRPGVQAEGGLWVDFGCGDGVFTRALARILGPAGRLLAVDRDDDALGRLRRVPRDEMREARIETVRGDFRDLASLPELAGHSFDGALFANALHFVADPVRVLRQLPGRLRERGRVLVVEYEGRAASPWVPHPIPAAELEASATRAGLRFLGVVARRPSRFGGEMYGAALERDAKGVESPS